ncbi:LYR motif-containing protein 5A [Lichtheimia hyalospora FSU 10163]|nr:LYR motif-containing protein 5A [Lichtheimia hyalospora FSU 10163]
MSTTPLRSQVIALYKQLAYLGREYPLGYENFFRPKLKAAFMKKRDLTDEEEIRKAIAMGEYVCKELEALYYLRKYRAMRRRYVQ